MSATSDDQSKCATVVMAEPKHCSTVSLVLTELEPLKEDTHTFGEASRSSYGQRLVRDWGATASGDIPKDLGLPLTSVAPVYQDWGQLYKCHGDLVTLEYIHDRRQFITPSFIRIATAYLRRVICLNLWEDRPAQVDIHRTP
jgi:hypothetical protein